MNHQPRPLALIILDGWGFSKDTDHNAIALANTPHWDDWWKNYPHMLVSGSGTDVGLPADQMGNSEVGHMHLGAGRIIRQDYSRINQAIDDKSFFNNSCFVKALKQAQQADKSIHIMGLLSPGGVHSHENHIFALIDLAKIYQVPLCVHVFLDGRDTPPKSAKPSLLRLEAKLAEIQNGKIASISGRYYAMDRDNRWDRVKKTYDAIVNRKAKFHADNALDALAMAYDRNENDEFVEPTIIVGQGNFQIQDHDSIIFMNFRSDRARQLTRSFTESSFDHFDRHRLPKLAHFITLTKYADDINAEVAFLAQSQNNTLGEIIAKHGLSQLRIAETEKYAHVTFFFNGGLEKPFNNEVRKLIPSPDVATYDLKPEMSAPEVTEKLIQAISSKQYNVIICNFANADMVGHTGNFAATKKAIECLDQCLGKIKNVLASVGGEMLITADHGNAEFMYDSDTQQAHTAHTSKPVPLVYIGNRGKFTNTLASLIDIAPTMLQLLNIEIPKEMTGKPLLTFNDQTVAAYKPAKSSLD